MGGRFPAAHLAASLGLRGRPVGAGPHGQPKTRHLLWTRLERPCAVVETGAREDGARTRGRPAHVKQHPWLEAHADEKSPNLPTASPTPGLALCVQGRNPPAWRRLARVGVSRGGGAGAPASAASFLAARKGPPRGPPAGGLPWRHQAAAFHPGRARTLYGAAQTGVPLDAATAYFFRHATAGCDRA